MFKKLIASLALVVASATAFAGYTQVDTSGLSEAQVAELKATAAKAIADNAKGVVSTEHVKDVGTAVTLAATWGQQAATAAEGFAKAIGIAAKELGVTVNDFLHTDAGRLTAAVIVWKVAGASIAKMLFAIALFFSCAIMVRVFYLRLFTLEYKEMPYSLLWGLKSGTKMVRIPKGFSGNESEGWWFAFIIMLGTIAVTAICIAVII